MAAAEVAGALLASPMRHRVDAGLFAAPRLNLLPLAPELLVALLAGNGTVSPEADVVDELLSKKQELMAV